MMIGGGDIYDVVSAMAPLYIALAMGYGAVKWWGIFQATDSNAINRLNYYFLFPFITLQFTAGIDPYHLNFRFLGGDVVGKSLLGGALALWVVLFRRRSGNSAWAITSFSLSALGNSLVVGVPMLREMYGDAGENLVVQSFVIQSLLWCPILLLMLELWKTKKTSEDDDMGNSDFGSTLKVVVWKLLRNPNVYSCFIGLIWALIAKRWEIKMPIIVDGCILIMAKAASGIAMFSTGLFMGLQEKIIPCGIQLALYTMLLKFIIGPLTVAIGCVALGLRSRILAIAIIQAALPESVFAFVFAREYGLHPDVLSTAVIFGTIVSLPLLLGYYAGFEALIEN